MRAQIGNPSWPSDMPESGPAPLERCLAGFGLRAGTPPPAFGRFSADGERPNRRPRASLALHAKCQGRAARLSIGHSRRNRGSSICLVVALHAASTSFATTSSIAFTPSDPTSAMLRSCRPTRLLSQARQPWNPLRASGPSLPARTLATAVGPGIRVRAPPQTPKVGNPAREGCPVMCGLTFLAGADGAR